MSNTQAVYAFMNADLFANDHVVVLDKPTKIANLVYDTELKQPVITAKTCGDLKRFIHICVIKINDPDHLYSYVEFETIDDYIKANHA